MNRASTLRFLIQAFKTLGIQVDYRTALIDATAELKGRTYDVIISSLTLLPDDKMAAYHLHEKASTKKPALRRAIDAMPASNLEARDATCPRFHARKLHTCEARVLEALSASRRPLRAPQNHARGSPGTSSACRRLTRPTLDYSLFPDVAELAESLTTDGDQADYLARVCGAWDFGIVPMLETFQPLRSGRTVFDTFPISGSPSYAAFRILYGWPAIDCGRVQLARYERLDERSRFAPDPFANCTNFSAH